MARWVDAVVLARSAANRKYRVQLRVHQRARLLLGASLVAWCCEVASRKRRAAAAARVATLLKPQLNVIGPIETPVAGRELGGVVL